MTFLKIEIFDAKCAVFILIVRHFIVWKVSDVNPINAAIISIIQSSDS